MTSNKAQLIYEDESDRVRLKVFRRDGQFRTQYSALTYRPVKTGEQDGKAIWKESHFMEERDLPHEIALKEIAANVISDLKRSAPPEAKDDAPPKQGAPEDSAPRFDFSS